MPEIYVKPNIDPATREPYRVRLPDKPLEFLPPDGAVVEQNKYWTRRLRDGSVTEAKAPKAGKTATKE